MVSTRPSVSSPIEDNSSAEVPLSRNAIVLRPAPTFDGSCTTLFAAVTRATDLSKSFPAATNAEPESCKAVAIPSVEIA